MGALLRRFYLAEFLSLNTLPAPVDPLGRGRWLNNSKLLGFVKSIVVIEYTSPILKRNTSRLGGRIPLLATVSFVGVHCSETVSEEKNKGWNFTCPNVVTIFASKGPNLQSRSKITRPSGLSAGVVTSVFFGQILEHDGILESSTSWYVIHSVI